MDDRPLRSTVYRTTRERGKNKELKRTTQVIDGSEQCEALQLFGAMRENTTGLIPPGAANSVFLGITSFLFSPRIRWVDAALAVCFYQAIVVGPQRWRVR